MEVIATDPFLSPEEIARRGAKAVSFEELLAQSDFVSLHCPRDASTMKMMNADAFARMKKGAIFITTARGGIHDEAALVQALRSGHLAGAGVDVWDQEPPPLDHPLLAMDNVFATFHVGRRDPRGTPQRRHHRRGADRRPVCPASVLRASINPEVWPEFEKRSRPDSRLSPPACRFHHAVP